jgi:hypothetical protein
VFWRPPPSYINPTGHTTDIPLRADSVEGNATLSMYESDECQHTVLLHHAQEFDDHF